MGHKPKLSNGIARRHVRSDVAQDVLVTEQNSAENFEVS